MTETGWPRTLLRGFGVFVVVLAIGVGAASASYVLLDPSLSYPGALRIGALYLGPFHHVTIVFDGEIDLDLSGLPGSSVPRGASVHVELGVALLAVTALAVVLLFRAGRASANGHGVGTRAFSGARVALGYAPPALLVSLLVRFEGPLAIGSFVAVGLRASLSVWQAALFPLVIAAMAAASGGVWSWISHTSERREADLARAVLGGGWLAFVLALALAYAGLLVAGIVQPDEPVAMATPSTARYVETVFERPGRGVAILAHHLAFAPNEALWTLVPAQGGCDVVRGSGHADLLCYGAFPTTTGSLLGQDRSVEAAPSGYLAFLLVPALATFFGGGWAARTGRCSFRTAVAVGTASGATYAAVVFAGCLLAGITMTYGVSTGPSAGNGRLWIGPDPILGTLLALAWGVVGGAAGGASAAFRRSRVARR